jgi:hypothetical protein
VEKDVQGWIQNTGGLIGFWTYTIVAELPLKPRIASVSVQASQVNLSTADLTPPFEVIIQASTNITSRSWLTYTNFTPVTRTNTILLPRQGDTDFFRLSTQ